MAKRKLMVRQGDVLLVKHSIPEDAVEVKKDGPVVLAEGESTGHAHTMNPAHVIAYLVGLEMYLRVLKETRVDHQEHKELILPPGDYKVVRQREYTPQEIRNVQD